MRECRHRVREREGTTTPHRHDRERGPVVERIRCRPLRFSQEPFPSEREASILRYNPMGALILCPEQVAFDYYCRRRCQVFDFGGAYFFGGKPSLQERCNLIRGDIGLNYYRVPITPL